MNEKEKEACKELLAYLFYDALKTTYDIGQYCYNSRALNESATSEATELANNFVDNLEANISDHLDYQEAEQRKKQEKQKLFDDKTFAEFKKLCREGFKKVENAGWGCCGAPVSEVELPYNFDGYVVVPPRCDEAWGIENKKEWDIEKKSAVFARVMFSRLVDNAFEMRQYKRPGCYFYGKRVGDFKF